MIRRVRMARKRLAIAREREWVALISSFGRDHKTVKELRRELTLRAIERRKDRIA